MFNHTSTLALVLIVSDLCCSVDVKISPDGTDSLQCMTGKESCHTFSYFMYEIIIDAFPNVSSWTATITYPQVTTAHELLGPHTRSLTIIGKGSDDTFICKDDDSYFGITGTSNLHHLHFKGIRVKCLQVMQFAYVDKLVFEKCVGPGIDILDVTHTTIDKSRFFNTFGNYPMIRLAMYSDHRLFLSAAITNSSVENRGYGRTLQIDFIGQNAPNSSSIRRQILIENSNFSSANDTLPPPLQLAPLIIYFLDGWDGHRNASDSVDVTISKCQFFNISTVMVIQMQPASSIEDLQLSLLDSRFNVSDWTGFQVIQAFDVEANIHTKYEGNKQILNWPYD